MARDRDATKYRCIEGEVPTRKGRHNIMGGIGLRALFVITRGVRSASH
jgi:hypothetical protein